jgi:hypothetical protein
MMTNPMTSSWTLTSAEEEWLSRYKRMNGSFKKKMVFRIGVDSGFFSEYTNMVLAMAYCLKYQIRFTIFSKHAVFALKNGLTDFFLPFVEEDDRNFHLHYNTRPYKLKQNFKKIHEVKAWILKERVMRFLKTHLARIYKWKNNIDYFTQDLWTNHRDKAFQAQRFTIQELGFHDCPLLDVTQKLIAEIWRYNDNASKRVANYRSQVSLPEIYTSIHIRSGDKIIEVRLRAIDEYMTIASKYSTNRVAFILTDDYTNIELLRANYSDWQFHTLCLPEEKGYFHDEFKKKDLLFKYEKHLRLFASIDLCCEGEMFVGTYSSAPGKFIGMRKGEEFCHCIDYDHWEVL